MCAEHERFDITRAISPNDRSAETSETSPEVAEEEEEED
jgi:hypothetical protein